jgi:hypothetical protein
VSWQAVVTGKSGCSASVPSMPSAALGYGGRVRVPPDINVIASQRIARRCASVDAKQSGAAKKELDCFRLRSSSFGGRGRRKGS